MSGGLTSEVAIASAPSIGVVFPARAEVADLPAFAVRAEEAGFDELWVVEDCFLSGGLVMAASALAVTRTLRVGVGLLPALMRNPALAAMEIATLDRLHPGRFSVALGHGVAAWMEQIGIGTRRRLAALTEVTAAVRRLLDGDTVRVAGEYVNLADVALEWPPAKRPRLLVGSTGPKGMAVGAREADGVLLPEGCGPVFIGEAAALIGTGADRVPECVVYTWARLDDEPDRLQTVLRPLVAAWAGKGHYPGPVRAAGAAAALERPERFPALVEELAVAGDAEACRRAVARRVEAGASSLVLSVAGDDVETQVERFAREVLPVVRAQHGDSA
jgi:5,10-methylenetetrahydromethanopterin reductase